MKYKDVVTALRAYRGRSYRGLFQEAADTIEALAADLQNMGRVGSEFCALCVHGQIGQPAQQCIEDIDSGLSCDTCPHDCRCKNCRNAELFEWRGVQKREREENRKLGRRE